MAITTDLIQVLELMITVAR